MDTEQLIKMANDIGAFFHGESTAEQAPHDVARFIERYWDPRMRRAIIARFHESAEGLDEPARSAVAMLATPPAAETPAGQA